MKKTLSLLLFMALATALLCGAALVDEEIDITGTWYGELLGRQLTLTLDGDGTYALAMQSGTQTGVWEQDGNTLTLDSGSDRQMSLYFDGAAIIMEDAVLTRVPTGELFGSPVRTDAELADFQGAWRCTKISLFGDLLSVEEYGDITVNIVDTELTLDDGTETQSFQGEFLDGALHFLQREDGVESVLLTAQLHADGTLSLSIPFGSEIGTVYYLSRDTGDEE